MVCMNRLPTQLVTILMLQATQSGRSAIRVNRGRTEVYENLGSTPVIQAFTAAFTIILDVVDSYELPLRVLWARIHRFG